MADPDFVIVKKWLAARAAGDVPTLVDMIGDNVVFGTPDRETRSAPASAVLAAPMKKSVQWLPWGAAELSLGGRRKRYERSGNRDGAELVHTIVLQYDDGRWRVAMDLQEETAPTYSCLTPHCAPCAV